jgi:hypothetical protein
MNADKSFVFNPRLSAAIDSGDFFITLKNACITKGLLLHPTQRCYLT